LVINYRMLKKHSFLAFFILLQFSGISQNLADSNYTDIATISDSTTVLKKTLIFFDSNNIARLDNLMQQQFVSFKSFPYKRKIPTHLVSKTAYFETGLFNSSDTASSIYFYPGKVFSKIIFYEITPGGKLAFVGDGSEEGICKLSIGPKEKKVFIIQLEFCRYDYNSMTAQLIQPAYLNIYRSFYGSKGVALRNTGFVLSGMLFLMALFVVVNYILTLKKEFLYYLGYVLSMFFLMLFFAMLGNFSWGSFASFFNGYLDLVLLILGNVFYLAFTRHFLDTKTEYKLLDKTFKITELFLIFLLVGFTFIHYFTKFFAIERFLENLMKFVVLGIGILFIVIAFKQKQKLIIYLAVGSAFAIVFSSVALGFILLDIPASGILTSALFYHDIGLIFALAFFLLGLTYKNRRELVERIQEQEALKLDVEKKDFEKQIDIIKAQQEERNRISADMHDDLGAGMTTIRLYSELAKSRITDTPIPEIEKISSSANELLNKMNAIIWSMSSSNDSLGNMVAYIRSYSLEYFEDTGIHCRISIPENLPNIVVNGEIRRNVFLVVKEALNNVLKHSRATEVSITLERVSDGLKLYIQDNGTGINFDKLRQFGNGLKNMQKRMEDIHIHFSIENNNGTLITLHRAIDNF
jgi:signal transduction histidine kinase